MHKLDNSGRKHTMKKVSVYTIDSSCKERCVKYLSCYTRLVAVERSMVLSWFSVCRLLVAVVMSMAWSRFIYVQDR